jgi:NAD(P)-dependent dehydrogenase (short-subunit alcohol dehydrogenase family)
MAETAVVTGAGRGFGREIARLLAGRGYEVLVTDVDESAAQATADAIGPAAWAMALDVRDPQDHRAAAAAASKRGRLTVWVNNAGVMRAAKAWEHSDDDVRLTVEANLLGVIWGSRAAIERMRDGGGHILNLGSLSAFGPVPGIGVYAASKHGVLGFTTSLQGDLDDAGVPIRVHVLCPDAAGTGLVQENIDSADASLVFSTPRMLTADEVAERAVALLDGRRIVLAVPRNRSLIGHATSLFPRSGLVALRVLRRLGERRRRKALEARRGVE